MQAQEQIFWEAVRNRDTSMDGRFVYAVTSTGIFCRPGCPSRRPRRDRVRFFSDPESARHAGFEPCRRCKPLDAKPQVIETVCRYIEGHSDEQITLLTLADLVGLSPFHLQRKFKAAVGITPREYAQNYRLKRFKALARTSSSVTDAMYEAGYGSNSRLYEHSDAQLGMTPLSYRSRGAGESIRFTTETTAVGRMLIAATERGICSIQFGSSEEELVRTLKQEFANASIERDELMLLPYAEQLTAFLDRKRISLDLPVDIRASAFQQLVWNYLRQIPYGETRSYSDVARSLGKPKATRAVARACATNPVAVVIPCHRVVRSDGGHGGYRWGLERKEALLALESED